MTKDQIRIRNRQPKTKARILDYLSYRPMAKCVDVADALAETTSNINVHLRQLLAAGRVVRYDKGVYGLLKCKNVPAGFPGGLKLNRSDHEDELATAGVVV